MKSEMGSVTVVCFTYKINGLKTNNYDKELAGAKFRLYSDAECQNEIFVKAKDGSEDNGYIVINSENLLWKKST